MGDSRGVRADNAVAGSFDTSLRADKKTRKDDAIAADLSS